MQAFYSLPLLLYAAGGSAGILGGGVSPIGFNITVKPTTVAAEVALDATVLTTSRTDHY